MPSPHHGLPFACTLVPCPHRTLVTICLYFSSMPSPHHGLPFACTLVPCPHRTLVTIHQHCFISCVFAFFFIILFFLCYPPFFFPHVFPSYSTRELSCFSSFLPPPGSRYVLPPFFLPQEAIMFASLLLTSFFLPLEAMFCLPSSFPNKPCFAYQT